MANFRVYQTRNQDLIGKLWMPQEDHELVDLAVIFRGQYDLVATVKEADDLEHVFEITNAWGPEADQKVEKLQLMHSLSVGDIVGQGMDEYVVCRYGFQKIN